MGIFDKFRIGLSKSSKNLSTGFNDLIFKRKIDENMLDELEDFLIQSDVGVESAKELREKFSNNKIDPKKCNVSLASVKNKKHVKIKVWERGAGLTKACGTAACATAVSGSILQFNERCVDIEFSEGLLNIDWKKDNNIYMTGKVSEIEKIKVDI